MEFLNRITARFLSAYQKNGKVILVTILALCIVLSVAIAVLAEMNLLPRYSEAKQDAKNHLEYSINSENVTLKKIRFRRVETKLFATREQDPVGYFSFICGSSPITGADGVSYENRLAYYRSRYGEDYDPEKEIKWAYIMTGTYKATHKTRGEIDGEFRIVSVQDGMYLCVVDEEHGLSEDVLRNEVKNSVMGYLLTTYDFPSPPKVEITYVEKDDSGYYTEYTVYGVVNAKNKFGEKVTGKFTAEYKYNNYDQYFERESLKIEELF